MPRLVLQAIDKKFGSTHALRRVDVEVGAGQVHAVLGENGAGKSTLMKVLSGAVSPDAGRIELDGAPYAPSGPAEARALGVAMVYQEPMVCPHLTVGEMLLLGNEPVTWGVLRRSVLRRRARQALAVVRTSERHAPLEPDILVGELSPAEAELVAIARALVADCRVLILDEPTSSLDRDDVERLFGVVKELAARGISVLYVSHFLDEVMRIADRYTVLRDGEVVGTGAIAEAKTAELVACMAGSRGLPDRAAPRVTAAGETVLLLEKLGGSKLPVSVSLELRRGEVLGIGGLVGSGRTELLRAVFGLDPVRSGKIRVGAAWGPASPVRRLAQGVGLLSEDRTGEGLMLAQSVTSNLTLSRLPRWILPKAERSVADRLVRSLGIRCRGPEQAVWELSGGNQQKVALGRLLHHDLDVLLLDEPTRGIDIVSRAEVHRAVRELCGQGKAVLVVSSYWPELLELCDRIAVMRRGVLGEARRAADWNEHSLLGEAMGA